MCAVAQCKSNNSKTCKSVEPNIRYFSFPSNEIIRHEWVRSCFRRTEFNVNYARICSRHFTEEDYLLKHRILNEPFCKWKLKKGATKVYVCNRFTYFTLFLFKDAIPSLNLLKPNTENSKLKSKRNKRTKKRSLAKGGTASQRIHK